MRGQDANALNTLGDHRRVRKGQLTFDFKVWVDELYGRFSLQWGIIVFVWAQTWWNINRSAYKSELELKGKHKCGLGYSPFLEIITDYSWFLIPTNQMEILVNIYTDCGLNAGCNLKSPDLVSSCGSSLPPTLHLHVTSCGRIFSAWLRNINPSNSCRNLY